MMINQAAFGETEVFLRQKGGDAGRAALTVCDIAPTSDVCKMFGLLDLFVVFTSIELRIPISEAIYDLSPYKSI